MPHKLPAAPLSLTAEVALIGDRIRSVLQQARDRETRLLILLGRAEAALPADDPLTREIAAVLRPSTLPATDTGD